MNAQKFQRVDSIAEEIKLTVDYNKTIEQAINDSNYVRRNGYHVTAEKFSISTAVIGKKIETISKLFIFDRMARTYLDEAVAEMYEEGYRPANIMELLAFGVICPDLQKQFPIIALGSSWRLTGIDRYVPCIRADGDKSVIYLARLGGDCDDYYHLLGVRI